MSSRARDLLRGSSSSSGGGGGKAKKSPMERIGGWIRSISTVVTTSGLQWGGWAYKHTRTIGWWVVTTGMITALPLLFEVKRELAVEEMEQLQINAGLAEGRTPQELANAGLSGAIEPKVLK